MYVIQFEVLLGFELSEELKSDLYTLRADASSAAGLKVESTTLVVLLVTAATEEPDRSLLPDAWLLERNFDCLCATETFLLLGAPDFVEGSLIWLSIFSFFASGGLSLFSSKDISVLIGWVIAELGSQVVASVVDGSSLVSLLSQLDATLNSVEVDVDVDVEVEVEVEESHWTVSAIRFFCRGENIK